MKKLSNLLMGLIISLLLLFVPQAIAQINVNQPSTYTIGTYKSVPTVSATNIVASVPTPFIAVNNNTSGSVEIFAGSTAGRPGTGVVTLTAGTIQVVALPTGTTSVTLAVSGAGTLSYASVSAAPAAVGVNTVARARSFFHGLKPCVDGTMTLGFSSALNAAKDANFTSEAGYVVSGTTNRIALVYQGYSGNSTGDTVIGNTFNFSASVELKQGSAPKRVTFGGAQTATMVPGGLIVSDPIGVFAPCSTTTAATVAGASSTVTVPNTSLYTVGQAVTLGSAVNNITVAGITFPFGGIYDTTTIASITNSTQMVLTNVLFNHPAGSPLNSVIYVRTYSALPFPNQSPLYTGTATGGTNATPGTIIVSTATPPDPNLLSSGKYMVIITGGTGQGQYGTIATYSGNTIQLTGAWSGGANGSGGTNLAPTSTSTYAIYSATQVLPTVKGSSAGQGNGYPSEFSNAPYLNWQGTDNTGAVSNFGNQGGLLFCPTTIMGDTGTLAIDFLGDSLTRGNGSATYQNANVNSQAETHAASGDLACWPTIAILNQGAAGDTARNFSLGNWPYRMTPAMTCDAQVVLLGGNDVNSQGHTTAQIEQDLYNIGTAIVNGAGQPYTGTIPPICTDTVDNFATVANQTIALSAAGEAYKDLLNHDMRQGGNVLGSQWLYKGSFNTLGLNFPFGLALDRDWRIAVNNLGTTAMVDTTATGTSGTNTLILNGATNVVPGIQLDIDQGASAELVTVSSIVGNVATLTSNLVNSHSGATCFTTEFFGSGPNLVTNATPSGSGSTTTIVDNVNLSNLASASHSPLYLNQSIKIVITGASAGTYWVYGTAYNANGTTLTFTPALPVAVTNLNATYTIYGNWGSPNPQSGQHPTTLGYIQMMQPFVDLINSGILVAR